MIIAIDFDGTIVQHAYPKIGKEIPFAFDTLKLLQKDRHLLILWTVRENEMLEEAVEFCRENGVEFYAINQSMPDQVDEKFISRKVTADLFIDDRNLGGMLDWGVIYQMIKSGNPFEQPTHTIENEYKKPKKSFWDKILGR